MSLMTVTGTCPACGESKLALRTTDRVLVCTYNECPRRMALHEILTTCSQPEHVVDLRATSYSMQHPMIERLDGVLLGRCPLDVHLRDSDGPGRPVGRYVVSLPATAGDWDTALWSPIEVSP